MQNISIKIITIFLLFSFFIPYNCFSQDLNYDLAVADSLFENGKYTESFDIFQAILETTEQLTPAMLLKMAYIKEGLGDHANALYYLNMYYLKTSDKHTLSKMENLAGQNELEGYSQDDQNIIVQYIYLHFNLIIGFLFAVALAFVAISIYSKVKLKVKPYWSSLFLILFLAGIFYLVNFAKLSNEGIIIEQGGFIMSGPSAGANLIDAPKKGHRIKIKGKEDVWLEIEWKGQSAYIKSSYVKSLQF